MRVVASSVELLCKAAHVGESFAGFTGMSNAAGSPRSRNPSGWSDFGLERRLLRDEMPPGIPVSQPPCSRPDLLPATPP